MFAARALQRSSVRSTTGFSAARWFASLPVQRLPNSEVVVVRYEDVVNRADISDSIAEAFGSQVGRLGCSTAAGGVVARVPAQSPHQR